MFESLKILLPLVAVGAQIGAAAVLNVPAGGDLQGTLNAAKPGDTVQIAAGARFVGHYFLPSNPGPQTITIQSSGIDSLPGGARVNPSQAGLMASLVTPDGAPALQMTTGANFFRIQGIEFATAPGVYTQDLVQVGNGGENSVGLLPHDIDFDRDYIHGDLNAGSKRGVALNGVNIVIENSYISAFTSTWQDTQAIAGWNGAGPFRIVNNYLEAGTEIISFGGATPAIPGVLPSDILIQNNQFFKPLSWQPGSSSYAGVPVWAKNHIELKFAQRVTIDNNTFDNNWVGADQRGFVMVFNVRAEQGAVPWAVVNKVNVTNNIVRHAGGGIVFVGNDSAANNQGSAGQFLVQNNLFEDIDGRWGGDGRLFQVQAGVNGINFDHNTAFESGYLLVFATSPSFNISFTNNIANIGWGVAGEGSGVGIPTLLMYALGGTFQQNALIGGSANGYPPFNLFPGSMDAVGFVNYGAGNFLLSPSSPLINAGTNGSALGASVSPNTAPAPAPSAPAPTAATGIPTGWVQIVNNNSGSCVDVVAVAGSETRVGTPVQQYGCWGGLNQQFQFTQVAGGYSITGRASNLQLDVFRADTADGTPVIQYPFWGGANQVWSVTDAGNGTYTLRPSSSGKCLDVAAFGTENGTAITQWSCNGGTNQQFRLVPAQ